MSLAEYTLQTVPQPLLALGIFLLLIGAYALGRAARVYRGIDTAKKETARDEIRQMFEGFIVSAVLGLLALLLGFTFSMAVDRYDQRFELEVDQANAISSTYLMAQTFEEPYQSRISGILSAYADNSLKLAQSDHLDRTKELLAESEAMQTCLWATSVAVVRNVRDDVSASFLDNARQVIDVSASRVAARLWHIPIRVHVVLLIYAIVTSFVLGFVFAGAREHLAAAALFALVTMSMVLIIDLDRPVGGRIAESEQPMQDLIKSLRANPPAKYRALSSDQGKGVQSQPGPADRSSEWAHACHYAENGKKAGQ